MLLIYKHKLVKNIFLLSLILIGLGIVLLYQPDRSPPAKTSPIVLPPPEKEIEYNSYPLLQGVAHTLLIPPGSRFLVTPAISEQLTTLDSFAHNHKALAAINGGFFDPTNQKSTAIVVVQGQLVADPSRNKRLMNNPNLTPYLKKILNRTEFRRYLCGQTIRYDITLHTEPPPPGCQIVDALGGGPRLLPDLNLVQEGFSDSANGKVIRDPLSSSQPDARSAIGITRDGNILAIVVAQKPQFPATTGMSLPALANFMKTLGVEKAMNLDGGSSSSLYYQGNTIYGKVNAKGNFIKRPIKSVLLIKKEVRSQ